MKTKFGNARLSNEGYYVISSTKEGNHGKKLHRLIFEDFYQIILPSDMHIHHNDGNKTNNEIWNLIPMTNSEHIRLHKKGCKMSDDFKRKMSKIHKGKKLSSEQVEEIRQRTQGEGNPMYGKHHDIETKQKISEKVRKYDFCGRNVYFKRNLADADNPRRCFEMRYNRWTLPIGWFMEWISCEIINDLIEEAT